MGRRCSGGARGPSGLPVVLLAMAVATGCTAAPPAAATADPSRDKLAQILNRGTLVEYFEPDYAPQSYAVEGATRPADTRCAPNELTAAEVTGFDNEITKLIAAELGVEACFVSPTWTAVTGGNWGDRWDIAYGSGAINATRMEHLWMTQPYYYIPQRFIVRHDAPFRVPSDLDGKAIGTCTSCTVESYLKGTLKIPGVDLNQKVRDPSPVGFETEGPGIDALVAGQIDAFLAAEPVGRQAIEEGKPLRLLDEPAFSMYPTGFIDKGSALDTHAFFVRINEIVARLHRDGRLAALSEQFFGVDYTTEAAAFDLSVLGQTGP